MAVESGIAQYAKTAASYASPLYIVRPGSRWGQGAPSEKREGVGGVGVRVGGLIVPKVALQLYPVDVNCLIDKILRATLPALPPDCILEVGDSAKSCQDLAWKINTAEIFCETGGALELTYELLKAVKPTYSTGGTPGTQVKTTFEWYRGYVTTGGAPKKAKSIRFRIANNLNVVPNLNTKASDKRYGVDLIVGNQTVEAEVVYVDDPAHTVDADELATSTIILVAVNNAGTPKTVTVTGTSMKVPEWGQDFASHTEARQYTVPYELDDNDLAGFTIAIA